MITGFNTDIEYDGTVYHVQTEDKGLETPFILSLVYVGGAILASKRAPYDDLVGASFNQTVLGERLQRQHKLICAAINAGRIEELKRMSQREMAPPAAPPAPAAAAAAEPTRNRKPHPTNTPDAASTTRSPATSTTKSQAMPVASGAEADDDDVLEILRGADEFELHLGAPPAGAPAAPAAPAPAAGGTDDDARAKAPQQQQQQDNLVAAANTAHALPERIEGRAAEAVPVEIDDALHVELLGEKDYHAGEMVTLRVAVLRGTLDFREIVRDASVTVKVLGTEFRPLILTSKTDLDGLAVIHVWLPRFKKGRGAILVRASSDGCSAELRRIIHHN